MDAKEYLETIRQLNRRVSYEILRAEQEEDRALHITQVLSPTCGASSGGSDRLADTIATMLDWQTTIRTDCEKLMECMPEAFTLLDRVEKPIYHEILFRRYFAAETMEQIADATGYSLRNVCYLHKNALKAFQQVLDFQDLLDEEE